MFYYLIAVDLAPAGFLQVLVLSRECTSNVSSGCEEDWSPETYISLPSSLYGEVTFIWLNGCDPWPPGQVYMAEDKLLICTHTALCLGTGVPWMPFGAPVTLQWGYSSMYSHFGMSVML